MPTCVICNTLKTRLDNKSLCSDCRNIQNDESATIDNTPTSLENVIESNIDANKQLSEISLRELLEIIKMAMKIELKPLSDKFDILSTKLIALQTEVADNCAKIEQLRADCDNHNENIAKVDTEVGVLKKVILRQQEYLETSNRKELRGNIIISGVPKGDLNIQDEIHNGENTKTSAILNFIGYSNDEESYEAFALPSPEYRDTYATKLKFEDPSLVKNILSNAKKLKNLTTAKIFIKKDEPYFTRKENARLRKRRYDLAQENRNDNFTIDKGKLYHNDVVVDKFDLNNQIF